MGRGRGAELLFEMLLATVKSCDPAFSAKQANDWIEATFILQMIVVAS